MNGDESDSAPAYPEAAAQPAGTAPPAPRALGAIRASGPSAWRNASARLARGTGLACLAVGVLLQFAVLDPRLRAALSLAALLGAAAVACRRSTSPPSVHAASLVILLASGGLLASMQQAYPDGSDTSTWLLRWALITAPVAMGAGGRATWIAWWAVLDVGLAFWAGGSSSSSIENVFLSAGHVERALRCLQAGALNWAGAAAMWWWAGRGASLSPALPLALPSVLAVLGAVFAGVGAMVALAGALNMEGDTAAPTLELILSLHAAGSLLIVLVVMRTHRGLLALTLVAANWIGITAIYLCLPRTLSVSAPFGVVAAWLLLASAAAAWAVQHRRRTWVDGGRPRDAVRA